MNIAVANHTEARSAGIALHAKPSFSQLSEELEAAPKVFELDKLEVFYGAFRAVRDASMAIHEHQVTAFIGPSGCGKTTVLRCLNRMNDLVPGARIGGKIL